MESTKSRWIGVTALVLLGLVYLSSLYRERERALWDFKTYYHAAQAFQAGEDPYDLAVLSRIAGEEVVLPYVYPPFTLIFFLPFTLFDLSTAIIVYFALKIAAILLLAVLWKKFLDPDFSLWFLPFALVVFNSALPLDLAAGNISVFEQIFLWMGFLFWMRGRDIPFGALVVAASLFKITPLFFLVLLFFREGSRRWAIPLAAVLAFTGIQIGSRVMFPDMTEMFLNGVGGLFADPDARGLWNPSTFALWIDLAGAASSYFGGAISLKAPFFGYVLSVGVFALATVRRLMGTTGDRERIVHLCLLYILMVPRLQVYSYLILIPPAFLLIKQAAESKSFPLVLFCVMSLSARDVFFPGLKEFYSFFWDYAPWMIALALWVWAVVGPGRQAELGGNDLEASNLDGLRVGPRP